MLSEKNIIDSIRQAVIPFIRLYPQENPLAFLNDNTTKSTVEDDLNFVKEVISDNYDRTRFEAVITQAVILYSDIQTGRLKFTPNVMPPNIESIFSDFNSEEAKQAAASSRMNVSQLYMRYQNEIDDNWAKYFWNHGLDLEPVSNNIDTPDIPGEHDNISHIDLFIMQYEQVAVQALNNIWLEMPKDLFKSQQATVIGALIARQCYLSVKLCRNPDIWEWNIGPLILRSMTDCYITLAWILKDPDLRSKQYIGYGLGQEKLNIEHYTDCEI